MKNLLAQGIIYLSWIIIFGLTTFAHAQEQFATDYTIYYTVDNAGATTVNQKIKITNKLKDVIAKNYYLTIRQMGISDVDASDLSGDLETEVTSENGETTIKATLEDIAVGEGQSTEFTIHYTTKDIASKVGEVWNINIPKVNLPDSTNSYTVSVSVPTNFGPELFVSPLGGIREISEGTTTYTFTKQMLEDKGVSAAFGQYQLLKFTLGYLVKNEASIFADNRILLPPDIIGSQQIAYQVIAPKPQKLEVDKFGNTWAVFDFGNSSELEVKVEGLARIFGKQINAGYGDYQENIPATIMRTFTDRVDAKELSQIEQELHNPTQPIVQNVSRAYNYMVQNDNAQDVAPTLTALLHFMNIPARNIAGEVVGFGPNTWVQFYDPQYGWVGIDPVWELATGLDYFTKLDTNHFALGINQNPNYLIHQKFDFLTDPDENSFEPQITVYEEKSSLPFGAEPQSKKYRIVNTGQSVVYVAGDPLLPNEQSVKVLPFLGYVEFTDATEKVFQATPLPYPDGSDDTNSSTKLPLILLVPLVLGLCTIFYVFLTQSKARRK